MEPTSQIRLLITFCKGTALVFFASFLLIFMQAESRRRTALAVDAVTRQNSRQTAEAGKLNDLAGNISKSSSPEKVWWYRRNPSPPNACLAGHNVQYLWELRGQSAVLSLQGSILKMTAWQVVNNQGHLIALSCPKQSTTVWLPPGGRLAFEVQSKLRCPQFPPPDLSC